MKSISKEGSPQMASDWVATRISPSALEAYDSIRKHVERSSDNDVFAEAERQCDAEPRVKKGVERLSGSPKNPLAAWSERSSNTIFTRYVQPAEYGLQADNWTLPHVYLIRHGKVALLRVVWVAGKFENPHSLSSKLMTVLQESGATIGRVEMVRVASSQHRKLLNKLGFSEKTGLGNLTTLSKDFDLTPTRSGATSE